MSKFQVGDRVVRTEGYWGNSYSGKEHVVREVGLGAMGWGINFEGDEVYTYSSDNYELIGDTFEEPTGA